MQELASEQIVFEPCSNDKDLYILMQELFQQKLHGFLEVHCRDIRWLVCAHEGKIFYASHNIDPIGRLAAHLNRLSFQAPKLTAAIRKQACSLLKQYMYEDCDRHAYYRVMEWLLLHGDLHQENIATLTQWWIESALELLLLEREGSFHLLESEDVSHFCMLDPQPLLKKFLTHLSSWTELGIAGASVHQRPYLFNQELARERLSQARVDKLSTFLRGDSFFNLAAKLNRTELELVKGLQSYICNGMIVLRDPQFPLDKLPRITPQAVSRIAKLQKSLSSDIPVEPTVEAPTRQYTIVCIDDSPAILNQLSRFLDGDRFDVHTISNPLRAMMSIVRIKPDAILLDIGMPNVDGYELCRLIRNHSQLQDIPIVMVTGHTGIFDRARAKIGGASGYLTKPFTQVELIELLTKYLEGE